MGYMNKFREGDTVRLNSDTEGDVPMTVAVVGETGKVAVCLFMEVYVPTYTNPLDVDVLTMIKKGPKWEGDNVPNL